MNESTTILRPAKSKPILPGQHDPAGRRARVLDAAASLFQVRGYHATSIHDLLDATGLSGGALHHHFPTKKAVALAVIKDRIAASVRQTWIDPVRRARSLKQGIAAVFAEIAAGIDKRSSVAGCPLSNLALELSFSDTEFQVAIQAIFAEWQEALAERIAKTRGGMRLNVLERREALAFIVSVYSGAMNLSKAAQSTAPLRSAAHLLSQWLRAREFAD